MSLFESIDKSSDSATEIGKKYVTSSMSYIKLKTFYVTALSISSITKIVLLGVFVMIGIVFCSVALAISLGDYFESIPLGCIAVGGLFFFVGFIIYLLRKTIDKKIIKKLSVEFF